MTINYVIIDREGQIKREKLDLLRDFVSAAAEQSTSLVASRDDCVWLREIKIGRLAELTCLGCLQLSGESFRGIAESLRDAQCPIANPPDSPQN